MRIVSVIMKWKNPVNARHFWRADRQLKRVSDPPDHSVISRFRTAMTKAKAYDKLLNKINKQLSKHNILVHTGVIVDASITDSPRKPKGKKELVLSDKKSNP